MLGAFSSTHQRMVLRRDFTFLSRLVRRASVRLAMGLFVVALVLMLGARWLRFNVGSDPFVTYAAILPGMSSEALRAFTCQGAPKPTEGRMAHVPQPPCSIIPPHGSVFHLITVETREEQIKEVTFYSAYLQINELMQEFGSPHSVLRSEDHQSFTFTWLRGDYEVIAVVSPPLGSTLVRLVTFTGK
jgi:hypothetical protein